MARCEVCGNEYYLSFEVVTAGNRHVIAASNDGSVRVWNLAEVRNPVPDVQRYVEALAAKRIRAGAAIRFRPSAEKPSVLTACVPEVPSTNSSRPR